MVLTIDIGNTNINLGLFENDTLRLCVRMATERQKTEDQIETELAQLLVMRSIRAEDISGIIISSVVPELTMAVKHGIEQFTKKTAMLLAPGLKTGLNIRIDNPAQLGSDLAAGAIGAQANYPLPAFVIDLGTATKIYAVDETGFRGCVIAPGIAISLKALTDTSSLLPTINLEPPKKACGTNSVESMQSGVIFGTAAMVDGLLDRFTEELGAPQTILATGGLSKFIPAVCKHKIQQDSHLILKGLKHIYDKNQNN